MTYPEKQNDTLIKKRIKFLDKNSKLPINSIKSIDDDDESIQEIIISKENEDPSLIVINVIIVGFD